MNKIEPFTLNNLVTNIDFVEVRGFDDGSGGFTATEVDVKEPDDVIIQGNLQSIIKDVSITVLGVSFQIDGTPVDKGETDFENTVDIGITQDEFITLAPVGTLVKVKDRNVLGVADEIDIETP